MWDHWEDFGATTRCGVFVKHLKILTSIVYKHKTIAQTRVMFLKDNYYTISFTRLTCFLTDHDYFQHI